MTGPALCMNCMHSGHCVFERASATPVMQCDEHLVHPTMAMAATPAPEPRPTTSRAGSFFVPTGLCITCDHVRGCGLRSSERIVLHCEHYE